MSDNAADRRPAPVDAVEELARVVTHLGDELASFRRRAILAEARLRTIEERSGAAGGVRWANAERIGELEQENNDLRARLDASGARMRETLDRVRFLRQQRTGETLA